VVEQDGRAPCRWRLGNLRAHRAASSCPRAASPAVRDLLDGPAGAAVGVALTPTATHQRAGRPRCRLATPPAGQHRWQPRHPRAPTGRRLAGCTKCRCATMPEAFLSPVMRSQPPLRHRPHHPTSPSRTGPNLRGTTIRYSPRPAVVSCDRGGVRVLGDDCERCLGERARVVSRNARERSDCPAIVTFKRRDGDRNAATRSVPYGQSLPRHRPIARDR